MPIQRSKAGEAAANERAFDCACACGAMSKAAPPRVCARVWLCIGRVGGRGRLRGRCKLLACLDIALASRGRRPAVSRVPFCVTAHCIIAFRPAALNVLPQPRIRPKRRERRPVRARASASRVARRGVEAFQGAWPSAAGSQGRRPAVRTGCRNGY